MNDGDIAVCKVTRNDGIKDIFIKNRKYKIISVFYDKIKNYNIIIESEDIYNYAYSEKCDAQYYIYDSFYTEEELRKLKLDSL